MWPTFAPADDITTLESYGYEIVENAFNCIVNCTGIDFEFAQGGCQQRAHVITMLLHKKFNIQHCKVWLFAPAALHHNDTRAFYVEDKNKLADLIYWNYHVAPAVLIKEGEKENFYVIDPCINRHKPILLDTWFKSIGDSSTGRYGLYFPEKYFFNSLYTKDNKSTTVFDGTFAEYTEKDKDDLMIEKGLAMNDVAMYIYNTYIKPMMEDPAADTAKLEDLKAIFGNATALHKLLSKNVSGYIPNTTHRYVVTYYDDILLDAKALFYKRMVHWTKYINELMK